MRGAQTDPVVDKRRFATAAATGPLHSESILGERLRVRHDARPGRCPAVGVGCPFGLLAEGARRGVSATPERCREVGHGVLLGLGSSVLCGAQGPSRLTYWLESF